MCVLCPVGDVKGPQLFLGKRAAFESTYPCLSLVPDCSKILLPAETNTNCKELQKFISATA